MPRKLEHTLILLRAQTPLLFLYSPNQPWWALINFFKFCRTLRCSYVFLNLLRFQLKYSIQCTISPLKYLFVSSIDDVDENFRFSHEKKIKKKTFRNISRKESGTVAVVQHDLLCRVLGNFQYFSKHHIWR